MAVAMGTGQRSLGLSQWVQVQQPGGGQKGCLLFPAPLLSVEKLPWCSVFTPIFYLPFAFRFLFFTLGLWCGCWFVLFLVWKEKQLF